jgi:hypothetical protein
MVFQKMKRPQRDFVVEIKSSRRLAKSKSSSIWGSLNLKAHAAEVEDQLRAADDGAARQGSIEPASASDSKRPDTLPLPGGTEPNDRQDVSATPSTIQEKAPSPADPAEPANIGEPIEAGIGGKGRSRKAKSPQMHVERQAINPHGVRAIGDGVGQRKISSGDMSPVLEALVTAVERYDPSSVEKDDGGSLAASQTNSKEKNAKSLRRIAGVARIARKNQTSSESSPRRDESRDLKLAGASSSGPRKNAARSQAGQKASRDLNKDLAELEVENRHLKKLLADALRKENAELERKLGFS